MGYTHYFEHKETTEKKWSKIKEDCSKVIIASKIILDGFLITNDVIKFNGNEDEGHEDFFISLNGTNGFHFCKTACKPYDLPVTACLLVYKYHSPETMDLSSDRCSEDWEPAEQLLKSTLDYSISYKEINKH